MTETASHIALRRVNGASASEWYIPFDGIHVSQDEDKCLVIRQELAPKLLTSDLLMMNVCNLRSVCTPMIL